MESCQGAIWWKQTFKTGEQLRDFVFNFNFIIKLEFYLLFFKNVSLVDVSNPVRSF